MPVPSPSPCDFNALYLGVLGFTAGDYVSLLELTRDGGRNATVVPAGDAADVVAKMADTSDCFFGVNVLRAGITSGRGTAADVTRLTCLFTELDVKAGAFATVDQARAALAELGLAVGSRATVEVRSGTGLHGYWPLADGHRLSPARAAMLLRRWHALVAEVAGRHGAAVDNVYELARMMRIPGSTHNKTGTPIPVTATYFPQARTLPVADIERDLDRAGIPHTPEPEAQPDGAAEFDAAGWLPATTTCGYAAALLRALPGDAPKAGRHQWMLNQRVRLLCALRHGCLTADDYQAATQALKARYTEVCASDQWGDPRPADDFEQAFSFAVEAVKGKSDGEVARELGGHTHLVVPVADFFAHADDGDTPGCHTDIAGEADFWTARRSHGHVFAVALEAMTGPWAVMNMVASHVLLQVPPNVVLYPSVGRRGASLNYIGANVAVSGSGKGLAAECRDELVPLPYGYLYDAPPGSGEGLSAAFFEDVPKEKGTGTERRLRPIQATHFHADEVDTLAALADRTGQTFDGQLRTAWTGGALGFHNASRDRRTLVEAHSYRLTMTVSAQPQRLAKLFARADGGTPQRVFWAPAHDPRIDPDIAYDIPVSPLDRLRDTLAGLPPGPRTHIIGVPDHVRLYVRRGLASAQQGRRAELDSHAVLARLKFAYALALMDGRIALNDDDWELSGVAAAVSAHTRDQARRDIEVASAEEARTRGRRDGVARAAAREAAVEESQRLWETQFRWLEKQFSEQPVITHTDLVRKRGNSHPAVMRRALAYWLGTGLLAVEHVPGGRAEQYRRTAAPIPTRIPEAPQR